MNQDVLTRTPAALQHQRDTAEPAASMPLSSDRPTIPHPIDECIQNMERQFLNDALEKRVVSLDLLPPEVQQAVIEEINRMTKYHTN